MSKFAVEKPNGIIVKMKSHWYYVCSCATEEEAELVSDLLNTVYNRAAEHQQVCVLDKDIQGVLEDG